MKIIIHFTLFLSLTVCLINCVTLPQPQKINLFAPEMTTQLIKEPLIIPGWALYLEVMADDLPVAQMDVKMVSWENTLSVPLLGEIDCTGLTIQKLSKKLTTAYEVIYQNPSVTIMIRGAPSSPWGMIEIYGCVNQEGCFEIPHTNQLSLTQAIKKTGGFTPQANRKIQITRTATPYDFPQLKEPVTQTMEFN